MKICMPVVEEKGLDSRLSEHFGSAPFFMIVDSQTKDMVVIKNTNQHHSHGMCQPLSVIAKEEYDTIIVGGIGAGALNKLNAAGVKVMKSSAKDVAGVLATQDQLEEVTLEKACSNHSCS